MPSFFPGFEYDIFISYRQKDNKYDGWVTEFVDHLKRDLESTFKEDISIYFDENPHDGLLETHNVDKSLETKLKSLIFIPIISQTYCDPKSFAWQYEFCVFNKLAKEDQLGMEIRLPHGNVASRILPVKIHDLDAEDRALFENEAGGYMRSIDFIYKSAGVNRPLRAHEDHPQDNLNKTYYRDQINKVANAVKDIATGLKHLNVPKQVIESTSSAHTYKIEPTKNINLKLALGTTLLMLLLVSGYFLWPMLFKTDGKPPEKSIAVLPFKNMSNDPEQEYFSDGMMEEILNHLFMIGGLKIPSSTSSYRYKGSQLTIREIARELDVSYILEGNVSKSGNNLRIIVRLINGKNEQLLWTQDYQRAMTATDIHEIQSDVAQQVANNMKVAITAEVKNRIEALPTENTEAYNLFLRSNYQDSTNGIKNLEKAILLDPGFADAHAKLAFYWIYAGGHGGHFTRDQVIEKAEPLLARALQLDNNSMLAHSAKATMRLYHYWDFETVELELKTLNRLAPSNSSYFYYFSDYLFAIGAFDDAFDLVQNIFDQNKSNSTAWTAMFLAYFYNGQQEKALNILESALELFPGDNHLLINSIRFYNYMEKYREAIALFENRLADQNPDHIYCYYLGHLGISYYKTGQVDKSAAFLNELLARSKKSPVQSPSYFAAAVYTAMSEMDKAIQFLEKAYDDKEVEMYWLKVEPLFRPLHGDPRFDNLLKKIGFE